MALEFLTDPRMLLGIALAIVGVGFWVVGIIVANWLWKRWRQEPDPE